MSDPALIVIAEVHGIADGLDQLDELVGGLIAGSVQEPECLSFRALRTDQPGELILLSQWSSEAALRAHYDTTHYRYYAEAVGPLLFRPSDVVVHHVSTTVHAIDGGPTDPRALG